MEVTELCTVRLLLSVCLSSLVKHFVSCFINKYIFTFTIMNGSSEDFMLIKV